MHSRFNDHPSFNAVGSLSWLFSGNNFFMEQLFDSNLRIEQCLETETKDSKVQTESDSKSGENAPTENEVNENMDENGNESGDSESEETGKIMEKKREKTFDGVESEKAKKKRLKQEKKEQLAILQNADVSSMRTI